MRLIPQEGLWPDFVPTDGWGREAIEEKDSSFTDKFQNNEKAAPQFPSSFFFPPCSLH